MPPTTATPMAIRPCAPSPEAIVSGSRPRMVEALVIRIGRRRCSEACSMASRLFSPASCFWLANSPIRIPFLATRPISMMMPIWLNMFIVCPLAAMNTSAPAMASGTVSMMTSGSLKLSNCAARIRYISTIASRKANIRLEELSRNSFESPASAVRKSSPSVCSAIRSISSSPCPMVFPFASPAETVADRKRL